MIIPFFYKENVEKNIIVFMLQLISVIPCGRCASWCLVKGVGAPAPARYRERATEAWSWADGLSSSWPAALRKCEVWAGGPVSLPNSDRCRSLPKRLGMFARGPSGKNN